jgi:hypothetical protein
MKLQQIPTHDPVSLMFLGLLVASLLFGYLSYGVMYFRELRKSRSVVASLKVAACWPWELLLNLLKIKRHGRK